MLSTNSIKLTKEIYFITNRLETIVNSIQEALLNNEFFDIICRFAQIINTLLEPLFANIRSTLVHFRN